MTTLSARGVVLVKRNPDRAVRERNAALKVRVTTRDNGTSHTDETVVRANVADKATAFKVSKAMKKAFDLGRETAALSLA
jgi:hypothetical protein